MGNNQNQSSPADAAITERTTCCQIRLREQAAKTSLMMILHEEINEAGQSETDETGQIGSHEPHANIQMQ
jgi:hypothetical protein